MSDQNNFRELLSDDFTAYPACEFMTEITKGSELGPWTQTSLHYIWRSERIANRRECPLPWRLIDVDGRRFLEQPEHYSNCVFRAGDPDWRDVVLELDLAVSEKASGPIVRYLTSRKNYWVAFEPGEPVKLIRRDQWDHVTLAIAPDCVVEKDRLYHCRVACEGTRISVSVDGEEIIVAEWTAVTTKATRNRMVIIIPWTIESSNSSPITA